MGSKIAIQRGQRLHVETQVKSETAYKFFYSNAGSLQAKMGEVECLVFEGIAVTVSKTETWWRRKNQ